MGNKKKIQSSQTDISHVPRVEWTDIKILSHTYDDWEIELFIPFDQVSDDKLPEKLKQVKELISQKYNLPIHALQYQNLIQKDISKKGIITHLRIKRISLDKGKPRFSFQSGISPSGIPYNDMACYADLFPLDEFDRELSASRITSLMTAESVVKDLILKEVVENAVTELQEKSKPLLGIMLAAGKFPDSGEDAEIEFYFHAQPSPENAEEYISSRKVKRGDIICSKNPPTQGKLAGLTTRGRIIPPRKGLDITLEPGKNVRINMEHTSLFADQDGLVVIRRVERSFMTPAGEKVIPSKILARVDPMMVIEVKDEKVEITTKESVEVHGNLKMGSRIISSGEIHIEGNVDENSNIHAADDIVVSGEVTQSHLSSDKNIVAQNNVNSSSVSARGNVIIHGAATKSTVVGQQVHIDQIKGGRIIAGRSLSVHELGADEEGISATICVATVDFLQQKIEENDGFLKAAKTNLEKLTMLFGEQIVNEVIPQNVQQMLLKFLSVLRREGGQFIPHGQVASYKRLLNSIEPLRKLIREKDLENIRLRRQIRRSSKERKLVIVKERVTARTKINIDNKIRIIEPQTGPLELTDQDI